MLTTPYFREGVLGETTRWRRKAEGLVRSFLSSRYTYTANQDPGLATEKEGTARTYPLVALLTKFVRPGLFTATLYGYCRIDLHQSRIRLQVTGCCGLVTRGRG